MEQKLIAAAIKSREAFVELLSTDIGDDFSDKAVILWKEIKDYYGNDPEATQIDLGILTSTVERKFPKHAELLTGYFNGIDELSVPNLMKEILAVKLDVVRHNLAAELVAGHDEKVDDLLDNYNNLRSGELNEKASAEVYINPSLEHIIDKSSGDNRIAVLPSSLNAQLKGGVLRQHHIVIFAPTDMGKTLFGLNMAYGFLKQGLKVLYCGNEDPATDMILRLMWRITGMTEEEIRKAPDKAQKLLDEKGFSNLVFVELAPGTRREIEDLIVEHEPDILMVDQIRNLDMGEGNKVLALEKSAAMMRMFGKKYDIVPVSFTQAGDSATGKMLLSRGDIDFSNVGIPGTADLLIGIGATDEMEGKGERMLSLVKNKVGGTKQPVKVWFDPMLTKVM